MVTQAKVLVSSLRAVLPSNALDMTKGLHPFSKTQPRRIPRSNIVLAARLARWPRGGYGPKRMLAGAPHRSVRVLKSRYCEV